MISRSSVRMHVLGMVLLSAQLTAQNYLSGRVYSGNKPDESTPIANVTVTLYGSANPDELGSQIGITTTQAVTGWYQLLAPEGYEYYHIVETTPSGYYSTGVSSVDGEEISNDHIRYSILSEPLADQTLTGNKFWDKPYAPDIEVRFSSVVIPDGSAAPQVSSGTDFGSMDVASGSVSRTYTIENIGTDVLNITGVTISGSGDFTVTSQPGSPVAAGASTTCIVRFDPSAVGLRSATVNIANNTAKNPYDFAVQGTGTTTPVPEIDVRGNGISIADGDLTPGMADDTDMGSVEIGAGAVSSTFLIHNTGSATLHITSVDVNPDNYGAAASFGIIPGWPGPAPSIAPGNSVSLGVECYPFTPGTYVTTVTIGNDDADENPYTFSVQGTGAETPVVSYDFGDAPEGSMGGRTYNYPTTLANNGARHRITRYGPWLGFERPDAELDGQPSLDALGDYHADVKDEAFGISAWLGISIPGILNIKVGSAGIVEVWIDYNQDGVWQHPAEQVFTGFLTKGDHYFTIMPPIDAKPGYTYIRARISTAGGLSPEGPANDGEVEDEKRFIFNVDFGDAPDSYGTLLASGGAYQIYRNFDIRLGTICDGEPDGQPGVSADGDDTPDINDDGITFLTPLIPDKNADIQVLASTPIAAAHYMVDGWIDFNGDKDFDPDEHIYSESSALYTSGFEEQKVAIGSFKVPANAVEGLTYARFRLGTGSSPGKQFPTGAPNINGPYASGEIEDYWIKIGEDGPLPTGSNLDFGDAPASYGDASHKIGGPWLGGFSDFPDPETASQYDPQAQGDDTHGKDDENGLVASHFIAGQTINAVLLDVVPSPSGEITIAGWLDCNGNGNWLDPGECLGSYHHNFGPMPAGGWQFPKRMLWHFFNLPQLHQGSAIARFRIYEGDNMSVSPTGSAGFGEVEDYLVVIEADGDPIPPGAVIFGTKWEDQDGDGKKDAGEPVLPGWEIWLDANQNGVEDAGDQYDFTDASGQFEFQGLSAGQYIVGEKIQSGWTQTCPPSPGTHTVTVDPTKPCSFEVLFGNKQIESDNGIGTVKWSQPPLYDPTSEDTTCYWGWNETSVYSQSFLADDWFCHDPRPVTCIRWWGAYADWDSLFAPPTVPEGFQIGVWTDVSNDSAAGFSHPGEMVREWFVSRNAVHETIDKTYYFNEFMEEPSPCFRYTYYIPENDWFVQEGDSTVYWLSIAAVYDDLPDTNFWGWLTREHYFNDDAVRVLQPLMPHRGNVYETGGMVSDFRDFAFELGTDEYQSLYDFGDAPDLGYGATLERNGPQHLFDPGVRLGADIDSEPDGQPRADARGDDDSGSADEDGVVFLNDLIPGETAGIQVTTSSAGYLNAWIDFHGDAKWNWPFDFVFTDIKVEAGTHSLEFPVLENAPPGNTIARFRFSTWPKVYFRGYAGDGEVEDYQVTIGTTSGVEQSGEILKKYNLGQNYPNPFNPSTQISFALPKKGRVELAIYNVQGAKVRTLVSGIREPGSHIVTWDGADKNGKHAPSGLYLCRIQAAGYCRTIKMLILK